MSVVISGTGIYTPHQSIDNKELVESYNKYADSFNETYKEAERIHKETECNEVSKEGRKEGRKEER